MGFEIRYRQFIRQAALIAGIMLVLSLSAPNAFALPGKKPDNRILAVKTEKNISLNDLIKTAGYSINDEDVVPFLTDFIELNPAVKSVSLLKKGASVRVPIKHLKKSVEGSARSREKAEPGRNRGSRKRSMFRLADQDVLRIDKSVLLRNIQRLFTELGEDVSLEREGFKYFSLGEKSDLSFDTGRFPIVLLRSDLILVVDYTDTFPEDVKNMLEVSWPEYRVVSPRGRTDLRGMVPLLLRESGYLFQERSKMVSGGAAQVEYYTDFLVHGKNGDLMDSDISLVSVLDSSEYQTPQEIISWFMARDIRIIELSEQDRKYINRSPGSVLDWQGNTERRTFVEDMISLMGYPLSRDQSISLSPQKEISFGIRADLLIDLGYRKKIIEFSGVTELELNYVRKSGLDIVQIEPRETREDAVRKIMSLLSLKYTNSPGMNAAALSPRKTRYRLFVPGFVVHSLKGVFLFTNAAIDGELKKNITGEGISVVTF